MGNPNDDPNIGVRAGVEVKTSAATDFQTASENLHDVDHALQARYGRKGTIPIISPNTVGELTYTHMPGGLLRFERHELSVTPSKTGEVTRAENTVEFTYFAEDYDDYEAAGSWQRREAGTVIIWGKDGQVISVNETGGRTDVDKGGRHDGKVHLLSGSDGYLSEANEPNWIFRAHEAIPEVQTTADSMARLFNDVQFPDYVFAH